MELHRHSEIDARGHRYVEFLRRADLSLGIYRLPAGAVDQQQPHTEDEVYVVISGRASFIAGEQDVSVGPGDVIYVPAREPHRFHNISEPIEVLVFFAPAEGLRK